MEKNTKKIAVRTMEIGEEEVWNRFVLSHPSASGYHLTGWRRVIEGAFGHKTFYLIAQVPGGKVQGVLPLVFLSSKFFGQFIISLPFLTYGGLLANSSEAVTGLLDAGVNLASRLNADFIELRHQSVLPALKLQVKEHKVSMRLPLPDEYKTLFDGFSPNVRRRIRRAQKEKMVLKIGGEELLDSFYNVFSRNMRDLGTPVYSRDFFAAVLRIFPTEARILVISLKGQPLAAALVYGFRDMLEIPWVSSDRRYNRLAANMLLYASVLEYAIERGFRTFDFGRSSPDSGTYRFKAQWGAKPVPLNWYYWTKAGSTLPDITPANVKFRFKIAIWKRLPLILSRWLGPGIVKYLP